MASHIRSSRLSSILTHLIFISNLYIFGILSSPVPQFQFPKNGVTFSATKNEKLIFSVSPENDEYQDVQDCLDDDYSMPQFNRTTGKFQCYQLLTQGPCDEGEWFVLDEEVRFSNKDGKAEALPTAICKLKECDSVEIERINGTKWKQETVMFNGKCTPITSSEECGGDHKVVLVNPFGEGECGCKDSFTEWNSEGEVGYSNEAKCYQEYLQGPCDSGHQLIPKEDVKITIEVNDRKLETSLWFASDPCKLILRENAENDFGSMCVPSDCKEMGQIRSKHGECIIPEVCLINQTLITSTEFTKKVKDNVTNGENMTTSCCLSDEEFGFRKYVATTQNELNTYGEKVKALLQQNACADYTHLDTLVTRSFHLLGGETYHDSHIRQLSALVTIPESCPRGQTITHDGECKLVRIWRTRPRRSSNSSSRIRQMMRYVRALRRQRPGISRINNE